MTINKRIELIKIHFFGNARGSHKKFIEKLSVASNTASNWMKDGYNVGKTVTDRILEAFPEVSAGWLLAGEGEMLKSVSNVVSEPQIGYEKKQDDVVMSREVFNQIAKLTETILSQQRTIESLTSKVKGDTADTA